MSLAIEVDNVSDVLLADGWHKVDFNKGVSSFTLDAYEFMWGEQLMFGGGASELIPATGFSFKEDGLLIYGPLNSILAVAAG